MVYSVDTGVQMGKLRAFIFEAAAYAKARKIMLAVIKAQGKQYKVAQGDTLTIDRLAGEAGAKVALGEVLMLIDGGKTTVGAPLVSGAKVEAEIVAHDKGDKVLVVKKRRRKGYKRTKGHRQHLTTVKITGISA
jgi:large subunit ribosomal protein L21